MQIRETSLKRRKRPLCPVGKKHKIHRHGSYERFGDCRDKDPLILVVFRFLCVRCGHTINVLPKDSLPYRAMPVTLVEKHFDAKANATEQPPATEKEKGCLNRAWTRFNGRVDALLAVLGQMISDVKPNGCELWNQLRRQSNLEGILLLLADPFKTSLLHDYRCLKPWQP